MYIFTYSYVFGVAAHTYTLKLFIIKATFERMSRQKPPTMKMDFFFMLDFLVSMHSRTADQKT